MMSSEKIIGAEHIHYSQLDSTNAEAKRLIDKGVAKEGMVITTDVQTQGRGQYGRIWNSEEQQNVMMSMIVSPIFIKIEDQFWLNIATGLTVKNIVATYCKNVTIKWPNDIFIGKKKVAGILIQNYIQTDKIRYSIIGVGLNVNQEEWPSGIPNATSLKKESGNHLRIPLIIDQICSEMDNYYKILRFQPKSMWDDYHKNLYGINESNSFSHGEEKIQGRIIGIDKIGRLRIEQNGRVDIFNHGDISLII